MRRTKAIVQPALLATTLLLIVLSLAACSGKKESGGNSANESPQVVLQSEGVKDNNMDGIVLDNNEYTAVLPKPFPFTITNQSFVGPDYSISFIKEYTEVKAYIAKLEAAGFVDTKTFTYDDGKDIMWIGTNNDYKVSITNNALLVMAQ
jgi:hypothetical protein